MTRPIARPRASVLRHMVIVLAALVVVASGCGSRLSHERLLADAGGAQGGDSGGNGVSNAAPGSATGTVVDGQQSPEVTSTVPGATGVLGAGRSSAVGAALSTGAIAASGCTTPKSPIIIGSVGQESGVLGSIFYGGVVAVRAWVAYVNAEVGGVGCHRIARYVVADDGGDPARHQALVQQLVEQDGVQAFVYMDAAITGESSQPYLTKKGIPVVGSEGGGQWFYNSPVYFPQEPHGLPLGEAFVASSAELARQTGRSRVGVLGCIEVSTCSELVNNADAWAAKYHVNLVYKANATIVQPDYTAVCQAAKQAGVQILVVGLDANSLDRLTRSCRSVQFVPSYDFAAPAMTSTLASNPSLDGAYLASVVMPALGEATSNPEIQLFLRVMKKYAPGAFTLGTAQAGWLAARLFELGLKNLPDPPTSRAMLEGLWAIGTTDLGGTTCPLTFIKGQNAPSTPICHWLIQIKGGAYVLAFGAARKIP
jgi:branched-chain amino acid transport system substrate-binding protein